MAEKDKKARNSVTPDNVQAKASPRSTMVKPQVSDLIGSRLKSYYNEVAEQPVPDRFLKLLEELETKATRKKAD